MTNQANQTSSPTNIGLYSGIAAYTMWGLFPIYFKLTQAVPPLEILAHRVVWALPFGFLIILLRKQIGQVLTAVRNPKVLAWLSLAAIALAMNWGVYIWAIQNDHIFQSSLGYYINPLIYVLVGVVFLKEKLRTMQKYAIGLAALGVAILTIYGGTFPYISLFLAISFTIYGVIRKQVNVGAMPGLFVETLVLFLPAIGYMFWLANHNSFYFTDAATDMKLLLLLAGPITVLPLLAFAVAARRLKLSTLGILQFIGPTLQFLCGLYYGESFTPAHALCFTCIWVAVALFSWDAWRSRPARVLAKQAVG